jgi:WD40 repeat protein
VRIHPDGERIVSFSKERDDCRLWAGDSGRVRLIARYGTGAPEGRPQYFVSTPRGRYEAGYCDCVGDVTFHPDGETMAVAGIGRPLELVDVRNGERIRVIADVSGPVRIVDRNHRELEFEPDRRGFGSVAFSATGRLIVANRPGEDRAEIFEVATGRSVCPTGENWRFTTHPGGAWIVSSCCEQTGDFFCINLLREHLDAEKCEPFEPWTVQPIQLTKKKQGQCWRSPNTVGLSGLAFHPSGDSLALLGDSFDDRAPVIIAVHEFPSFRLRFLLALALGDDQNRASGWEFRPSDLAYDPGGRILYIPTFYGDIVALDAHTGDEVTRWTAHGDVVTSVDATRDSPILVSGGADGRVRIWDVSSVPGR